MKINTLSSTNYKLIEKDQLLITFTNTTLQDILELDTKILNVVTDAEQFVESFVGWQLQKVTYNKASNDYDAYFIPSLDEISAKLLEQLLLEKKQSVKEITELQVAVAEVYEKLV